MKTKSITGALMAAIMSTSVLLAGCSADETVTGPVPLAGETQEAKQPLASITGTEETNAENVSQETFDNSEDGGHAIEADGKEVSYSNGTVTKTGEADGDEADFYGDNAAIFATNGAKLMLSDMNITTNGTHANAVFSYGEGTQIDISNSTIETIGNCSGGLMTTGGGTMNASNLTIHTTGNSSAAIRSDRGGGVVTVNGGNYTTDGKGSPAIYSTADITVNDAALTSSSSQGVVVEGKNSVTLNNVVLNASNTSKNSDKSEYYQAVMIYQSMSGDADTGLAKFTANGGNIANTNGDIFFVNNTATDITLSGVDITNNGGGVFLRAAAAGWGKEGENGGKVNLTASAQKIDGDMLVDDISILNLYLNDGSTFNGAINPDGDSGDVYVELIEGSKWTLTADSNIKSLTCEANSIDLNGHTLTVNGRTYTAGSKSTGDAIDTKVSEQRDNDSAPRAGKEKPDMNNEPFGDGNMQPPSDGEPPAKQDKEPHAKPDGEPPEKPNGTDTPPDGNPPEKPN
ncbi:MAG: hypothetical protein K6F87_03820 [Lachnospiraceae bacterium]|nr:hypothetical protein [Lachnospiraceae bacterium]